MTELVGGFAVLALVLLVAGRWSEVAKDVDWRRLITPARRRELARVRERLGMDGAVVDLSLGRAVELAAAGDHEEAVRLLVGAYVIVAQAATDRAELLRCMARYSRMLTCLMPLPPVAPSAFRLRSLVTMAGVGALAHYLLVTVPERLRLRLLVLRCGGSLLLRAVARAGARGGPPRWDVVAAAQADWHTIDEEAVESFRALLTGIARHHDTGRPAESPSA